MSTEQLPTIAVKELVSYDKTNGTFTWARSRGGRVVAGKIAGRPHGDGYWRINLMGKEYLAHRLAWLISFNEWPISQIDHINGVRSDNRLSNLRQATNAQNAQNTAIYKTNKSGLRGVSFKKGKWLAQIQLNKVKHHIGYFSTKELASSAYLEHAKLLFGEFLRKSA